MLFAGRAPDVAERLLGRRLGPSGTSPGDQGGGFLAHLHSLAVTMSQKSSASQPASAVSWALTPNRQRPLRELLCHLRMRVARPSPLRLPRRGAHGDLQL